VSICLAVDTATDGASVALGDGENLIAEINLGRRRAARTLTPAIEQCLRLAGLTYEDLDSVAVADGPGSFTGLRIAFATVQGIVTQRDIPVFVAPSLMVAALAARQPLGAPVAVLYDALRGEVFAAVFSFSATQVTVHLPPSRLSVEHLIERCDVTPAVVVGVGDGVVIYAAALREWTGNNPMGAPLGGPRASCLIALKGMEGGARLVSAVGEFEPDYGRLAEAQVRWEAEHGRPLPKR